MSRESKLFSFGLITSIFPASFDVYPQNIDYWFIVLPILIFASRVSEV